VCRALFSFHVQGVVAVIKDFRKRAMNKRSRGADGSAMSTSGGPHPISKRKQFVLNEILYPFPSSTAGGAWSITPARSRSFTLTAQTRSTHDALGGGDALMSSAVKRG
jgi:hypothetical protein